MLVQAGPLTATGNCLERLVIPIHWPVQLGYEAHHSCADASESSSSCKRVSEEKRKQMYAAILVFATHIRWLLEIV